MTEKIIGCGALFYSKETNRFLLLHRTQSKQNRVWGLVGGTTTDELAWAGLKREIKEEIGDVITVIEILKMSGMITEEEIQQRMKEKRKKLKRWSNILDDLR